MNRLLIGILDIVNKLLALFVIVSSTVSGYLGDFREYVGVDYGEGQRILGAIAGFIAGLILAGLISGFIAAVITIAREITYLREILASRGWATPPPP